MYTFFGILQVKPVDGFSCLMAQMMWICTRVYGGFVHFTPFLGSNPQKPKFWVWIGVSGQTGKILTVLYYRNYCVDSYQILQNDRYHQVVIVGGVNTWPTNPRWWTAAVLKKNIKSPYLCSCLTDFDEFWHTDAYWPLTLTANRPLKFRIFENPKWWWLPFFFLILCRHMLPSALRPWMGPVRNHTSPNGLKSLWGLCKSKNSMPMHIA